MDYSHGRGHRIIMNEFKFVCPSCGQKIKVDSAATGRQFPCPGCQSELLIPAAPKRAGEVPAATLVPRKKPASKSPIPAAPGGAKSILRKTAKLRSTTAGKPLKTSSPKGGSGSEVPPRAAPKPENPTVPTAAVTTASEAAVSQEKQTHVASLTPAVKREIIRSVRQRIANPAHWMPRITPEGKYAYAAREVDGKSEPIEVTSPEATRFSILGAALLELHLRNVTQTATGRAEFLDQELLDAIRQVAGNEAGTQEADPGESPAEDGQVPPVSHAQSLQALDLLEEQYTRNIEESAVSSQRLEDLRMTDLARKIGLKVPIAVEEICAALANELNEIDGRLKALERPVGKSD